MILFPQVGTHLIDIVPDDTADIPGGPCILVCTADGDAVVVAEGDEDANEHTFAMVAGDVLDFVSVRRVMETSTGTFKGIR